MLPRRPFLSLLAVSIAAATVSASPSAAASAMDDCLLDALSKADESMTVGEIRADCDDQTSVREVSVIPDDDTMTVFELGTLEERIAFERDVEQREFTITPHEPNYILWSTVDDANQSICAAANEAPGCVEEEEMKFQVSFKVPIWRNMFGTNMDTYFAYTATSWWQLFNDDISSPFRETNYQPEFFVRNFTNRNVLGANWAGWSLGFNHQSNGRNDPISRSWNRIIGRAFFGIGDNIAIGLRAWHRIEEDEEDDDNPRIYQYLGYGDLRAVWTPRKHTISAMVRPGSRETSYELTWSYPISKVFRVYAQYYDGYGESLIDYDFEIKRFAIGVALNDYLQRQ